MAAKIGSAYTGVVDASLHQRRRVTTGHITSLPLVLQRCICSFFCYNSAATWAAANKYFYATVQVMRYTPLRLHAGLLEQLITQWGSKFKKDKNFQEMCTDLSEDPQFSEQLSRLISNKLTYTCSLKCSFLNLTDNMLAFLAASFSRIHTLDLSQCFSITDRGLELLSLPSLTSLDVYLTNITGEGWAALSTNCPGLRSFNCYNCDHITDHSLTLLALPQLNFLNLSCCKQITGETFTVLSRQCPEIRTLNLWGCQKITDRGLASLKLMHLMSLQFSVYTLTGEGWSELSRNCPQLHTLTLDECGQRTDPDFAVLAPPSLTSLAINKAMKITREAVALISRNCPQLTTLELAHANLTAPNQSSMQFAHLTNLKLAYCTVNAETWAVFARSCFQLRTLHLVAGVYTDNIFASLPHLTNLILETQNIRAGALALLSTNCPQLQTLTLKGCNGLRDDDLVSLNLPELRVLHLYASRWWHVTPAGTGAFSERHPKVRIIVDEV